MKILILSDSHSQDISTFDFSKYSHIIHAGDYGYSYDILNNNNILFVKGNCDYRGDKELIINLYNKKILITHGDLYNVKNDYYRLLLKAESESANYVIFGHTHIPSYFVEHDIVFINPGAYLDGYYVIIDEEYIKFYRYNLVMKEIKRKW